MSTNLLANEIMDYQKDFSNFMDIHSFPSFTIITTEVSEKELELRGYAPAASASYESSTQKHELVVRTNIPKEKYLFFHEFTHMLDAEQYVANQIISNKGISGFTEYHASQVELIQLLGAKSINDSISFTMDSPIVTIGGTKSVSQYIEEKFQLATELFSSTEIPNNEQYCMDSLGVLFNYFGLRSICKMYSVDYSENVSFGAFVKYISTYYFYALNNHMCGWFDGAKIIQCHNIYLNILQMIKGFQC